MLKKRNGCPRVRSKLRAAWCVWALVCAFGAALLLASCASAPRARTVAPLEALSPDAALYVYVPVQQYQALVCEAVQGAASGSMSEKDVARIVARTEAVYVAVGAGDADGADVQFAVTGAYPQAAVKAALSAKRGWTAHKLAAGKNSVPDGGEPLSCAYTYYERGDFPLQLSFVRASFAVASRDVRLPVARYDAALFASDASDAGEVPAFLSAPQQAEIRFAAPDAQALLQLVAARLGADVLGALPIAVRSVYGSLASAGGDDCTISLVLALEDGRTARAAAAMLKLALLATDVRVGVTDDMRIEISNYTIPWKTVLSSFNIIK